MRNLAVLVTLLFGCSEPAPAPNDAVDSATNSDTAKNNTQNAEPSSSNNTAGQTSDVTYFADVKPILDGRCVACHTEGEIGPFPLDSFESAAPLRQLIASVVEQRTMPPFLPVPGCNEYSFDPSLSDEQIDTLVRWAQADEAVMGDPASQVEPHTVELPPPPDFDTTLSMPQPYTPQLTPDDYRCFVIDWPFEDRRYVTGFGVEPGDPRIVHHIIAYHVSPENAAEAAALEAAENGPGYTCFGGPGIGEASDQSWLGGWAPGGNGTRYPVGTGLSVEPGSKVVIQVHYNTLGTDPMPDKTKILFETAESVDREGFFHLWASPAWLSGGSMEIPAGDPDVTHRFSLDPTLTTNGRPITLYSTSIHMHLLGRQATSYIIRESGDTECLVQIDNYDFSWQSGAAFAQPVTVNPGDRLVIECTWDNSMANQPVINGEQIRPDDRAWGEGTTDEMCLGIYYATVD